jgi:hypothetical protein
VGGGGLCGTNWPTEVVEIDENNSFQTFFHTFHPVKDTKDSFIIKLDKMPEDLLFFQIYII